MHHALGNKEPPLQTPKKTALFPQTPPPRTHGAWVVISQTEQLQLGHKGSGRIPPLNLSQQAAGTKPNTKNTVHTYTHTRTVYLLIKDSHINWAS